MVKNQNEEVIISSDTIHDRESYEALFNFCEDYAYKDTDIAKKIKAWLDYSAWDFAAWYVGDDV